MYIYMPMCIYTWGWITWEGSHGEGSHVILAVQLVAIHMGWDHIIQLVAIYRGMITWDSGSPACGYIHWGGITWDSGNQAGG